MRKKTFKNHLKCLRDWATPPPPINKPAQGQGAKSTVATSNLAPNLHTGLASGDTYSTTAFSSNTKPRENYLGGDMGGRF